MEKLSAVLIFRREVAEEEPTCYLASRKRRPGREKRGGEMPLLFIWHSGYCILWRGTRKGIMSALSLRADVSRGHSTTNAIAVGNRKRDSSFWHGKASQGLENDKVVVKADAVCTQACIQIHDIWAGEGTWGLTPCSGLKTKASFPKPGIKSSSTPSCSLVERLSNRRCSGNVLPLQPYRKWLLFSELALWKQAGGRIGNLKKGGKGKMVWRKDDVSRDAIKGDLAIQNWHNLQNQ